MNHNNNLLHALAAGTLVIILVYAGEQWINGSQNNYISYTLWTAGIGISSFVLSFLFGFLNSLDCEETSKLKEDMNNWFLFEGKRLNKLELSLEQAESMQIQSENYGWYAFRAMYLHKLNLLFTFIGAFLLTISPILYVLGVLKGN